MTMSQRAQDLTERLTTFNREVMAFVERCTDTDWGKGCAEDWTVGVVARHIGAAHYDIIEVARMIVNGEKLPEFTMDQFIQSGNQHAREHGACTKAEVMDILRNNGETLVRYVAGLDDAELSRTGYLSLMGGDVSAQQFIETIILHSGGEHLANMKAALSA
jgi:hypothetical protein